MKNIATRSLLMVAFLFVAACSPQATATPEPVESESVTNLIVSGSGSVTGILRAIADDFASDVPGYQLEVLTGSGTGGGVKGIIDGALDVAAMARPPRDAEAEQGVEYVQLGIGGVAVIVHPDVEITALTSEQIVAIFTGEITNWSELGGTDTPITAFVRDEGDSSTSLIREHVIGDLELPETQAEVLTSQSDMLTNVAGTPGAIGWATWPTTLALETDVIGVTIDELGPGDADYPMQVTLGIGFLADRREDMQPLVDWLQSDAGRTQLESLAIVVQS